MPNLTLVDSQIVNFFQRDVNQLQTFLKKRCIACLLLLNYLLVLRSDLHFKGFFLLKIIYRAENNILFGKKNTNTFLFGEAGL
jgi:hypothetical protein